jgi:hypothetical protein
MERLWSGYGCSFFISRKTSISNVKSFLLLLSKKKTQIDSVSKEYLDITEMN